MFNLQKKSDVLLYLSETSGFTGETIRVKCEKNKLCTQWDSNPQTPVFAVCVFPLDHMGITVEKKQHRG